ncbi:P27 family predicted phage terminase small subunit [Paraburkholderia sp. CI2]|uniref:phage terminase small subunit P27 family n=1 Tax=Paraburkholderia sp. CI2 TaxID=2723093 RepID=UPI00160DE989|nr:phage terminase small subunit P27 family [Paraburkholderia sp. CI2]MBB5469362.1 P27 family predicted phage terminase small subunit [Paraburkholderia sp. CI2]
MSNPRKPTALRIIEGNRGHRPIPKNEPKPRRGVPKPPAHLDSYALAEWDRITPELDAIGMLTTIDGTTLAAYCQCVSRWMQAEESIQRMKARDKLTSALMIKTSNGNAIQNPLVGVANRAMLMAIRFASEFGMSPAARARLSAMPDDPNPNDRKESYF